LLHIAGVLLLVYPRKQVLARRFPEILVRNCDETS
jgi:hypothetical protein